MIELNKEYNTQELAQELGISYVQFRKYREKYEQHLALFYDYIINRKGNGFVYYFKEQYDDYISYKEYANAKRSKTLRNQIVQTIERDNRQTGANIARIIIVNKEIEALNLKLSTLTNYTRTQLKELLAKDYYVKEDYRWCYLNKMKNAYVLMSDEEVQELRSYFRGLTDINVQEELFADFKERLISKEEFCNKVGEIHYKGFMEGLRQYSDKYNVWPIKVPVYVRNALVDNIE